MAIMTTYSDFKVLQCSVSRDPEKPAGEICISFNPLDIETPEGHKHVQMILDLARAALKRHRIESECQEGEAGDYTIIGTPRIEGAPHDSRTMSNHVTSAFSEATRQITRKSEFSYVVESVMRGITEEGERADENQELKLLHDKVRSNVSALIQALNKSSPTPLDGAAIAQAIAECIDPTNKIITRNMVEERLGQFGMPSKVGNVLARKIMGCLRYTRDEHNAVEI